MKLWTLTTGDGRLIAEKCQPTLVFEDILARMRSGGEIVSVAPGVIIIRFPGFKIDNRIWRRDD